MSQIKLNTSLYSAFNKPGINDEKKLIGHVQAFTLHGLTLEPHFDLPNPIHPADGETETCRVIGPVTEICGGMAA